MITLYGCDVETPDVKDTDLYQLRLMSVIDRYEIRQFELVVLVFTVGLILKCLSETCN